MGDQSMTPGTQPRVRRRLPRWQLVIGILLLLAAGVHYLKTGYRPRWALLWGRNPEPIQIAPDFQEADALPVGPGTLANCNVLLVTLDTTRADRLGCYGNEDIETPTLDRLAREGVIFSRCAAVTPTTLPSHTSILTGLYPCHHGSRVNGLYRLGGSYSTLAELLAESGYATGAVISAYVLDGRFGLDQGFDHYDDDLSDCEEPELYRFKERKADKTSERAVGWLRDVKEAPFLLWVHYFDPHAVYEPPSPYAEQYKDNPYDGEIAFVDAQLGKLIDALDELGLTEQTLVVVVGDHGDSLGQHNELTHAFLVYEATLRVPLIMRCGQRLGGGVHVSRLVSQVDIVPTILSLLGLPQPVRTDGVDLTLPELEPRPLYAETLHGLLVYGWAALVAVYDGSHKYIHGPRPELFDLSEDPSELTNLVESQPELAAALEQKLIDLFGPDLEMTEVAPPTETLSMTDLEKLRQLGYVGAAANIPPPADRPDPHDMMPAMHMVEQAMFSQDSSQTNEKKIESLREVISKYPDFHPALRYLGDMCRIDGRAAEAEEAYQRCIELCPDPTTLWGLALTKLYQGETEAAWALLREIVSKYPDHLPARYFLGVLAGRAQDYPDAAKHFEYLMNIDPDFAQANMPPCAVQLVQACVAAGRAGELPGVLQPRLEASPRSVSLRAALATYYISQEQYAAAEALLREGVALMPDDHATIGNLAMFLVGSPDPQTHKPYEGIAMIERLCEKTAYKDPEVLKSLSGIYAAAGRLDEALAIAGKAKDLAEQAGKRSLAQELTEFVEQLGKVMKGGRAPRPPLFIGDD